MAKWTGWADQVFLCDLGGFRISNTASSPALLFVLPVAPRQDTVVVTFHLVAQHLRLISARRWDEVLIHERKNAITDLLELPFHFRDVLSRM